MSLWKRGNGIIKQPVYGPDVAKGIVKAVYDPDAAGHTFQAVGYVQIFLYFCNT